jgi:hypothetical protein
MRNPFLQKLNPSTYQMISNQATVKNLGLISTAENPSGPIETADRKLTAEKQKSLPLPFEMAGRRKTLLLRSNPIPL